MTDRRVSLPSPRRRLLSVGLLLAASILVVATGFLFLTDEGYAVRVWLWQLVQYRQLHEAEQKAADALTQRGLLVISEEPDKCVSSVNFCGKAAGADAIELLPALYRLQSLTLSHSKITDEQLVCVSHMPQLSSLVLAGTPIGDDGLLHLQGLRNLEALHLSGTKVTDAGLARLAALHSLAILNLSDTQVTDQGLPQLLPLKQLAHLLLIHDRITDAGLVQLEALPNLKRLSLEGTKVTAAGIARLKKAKPALVVDR